MTTVDFLPTSQAAFQFQPTLDGAIYTAIVTWSVYGQRYYLNLYKLDGTLVLAKPLIGSPDGVTIETLAWSTGTASGTTSTAHGLKVGATARLTISGATPDAYDGTFLVLATGVDTFEYPLPLDVDPGAATIGGAIAYGVDVVGGYFETSTLVFRDNSQRFEISP